MIAILFVVIRLVSIVDANFVQLQRTFLNVIQDLNNERASLTETQLEQHHAFIHVLDQIVELVNFDTKSVVQHNIAALKSEKRYHRDPFVQEGSGKILVVYISTTDRGDFENVSRTLFSLVSCRDSFNLVFMSTSAINAGEIERRVEEELGVRVILRDLSLSINEAADARMVALNFAIEHNFTTLIFCSDDVLVPSDTIQILSHAMQHHNAIAVGAVSAGGGDSVSKERRLDTYHSVGAWSESPALYVDVQRALRSSRLGIFHSTSSIPDWVFTAVNVSAFDQRYRSSGTTAKLDCTSDLCGIHSGAFVGRWTSDSNDIDTSTYASSLHALRQIMIRTNTDKTWRHGYDRYYTEELMHLRRGESANVNVLEIGTFNGASLAMWVDYFGARLGRIDAVRYGVGDSVSTMCTNFPKLCNANLHLYEGDQSDRSFLAKIVSSGVTYDLIVDDGSHVPAHQVLGFKWLFPILNPGGLYIIEDIETSYWNTASKIYHDKLSGAGIGKPAPGNAVEAFKLLADVVNRNHFLTPNFTIFGRDVDSDVRSVSFGANIVFVRKFFAEDSGYPRQLISTPEVVDRDSLSEFQRIHAIKI